LDALKDVTYRLARRPRRGRKLGPGGPSHSAGTDSGHVQSQSRQSEKRDVRRREHIVGADISRVDQKRAEEQDCRDYAKHDGLLPQEG
ncbi:hypothetical protein, partial [Streptomyces achromogenes]|uniref:hypothetical protein n=1 Tax=Streptomyces achromogenes TaxID=67255 RepID=UPI00343D14B7